MTSQSIGADLGDLAEKTVEKVDRQAPSPVLLDQARVGEEPEAFFALLALLAQAVEPGWKGCAC